jgi:hypothetical protein
MISSDLPQSACDPRIRGGANFTVVQLFSGRMVCAELVFMPLVRRVVAQCPVQLYKCIDWGPVQKSARLCASATGQAAQLFLDGSLESAQYAVQYARLDLIRRYLSSTQAAFMPFFLEVWVLLHLSCRYEGLPQAFALHVRESPCYLEAIPFHCGQRPPVSSRPACSS